MTEQQLDDLYTQACYAMAAVGEAKAELFLGRLVLLLMRELDDPQPIARAIAQASEGL